MKYKVLLVDDSIVNREFLKAILEDNNFEIFEAESGEQALDSIQTSPPDIMMLDLTMPNIGGLDTLRRVRDRGFKFPIIIFTSDYKEETRIECLKAGANEVLHKPSKPYHLMSLINGLLANTTKV